MVELEFEGDGSAVQRAFLCRVGGVMLAGMASTIRPPIA
jgi:hypothetical protein